MNKKLLFILPTVLLTSILYIGTGRCNELDKCREQLQNSDPEERKRGLACFTISSTVTDKKISQKNIELIIPLLYDEVENIRNTAILLSGNIFLEPPADGVLAMPYFQLPRLKKDDTYIKAAKLILPHLIEKLKNENELLQSNALFTIACIGMIDNNIDVIIEKLDSKNDRVRSYALVALANIDGESKKAISKIENMMRNDESLSVKNAAESAWVLILESLFEQEKDNSYWYEEDWYKESMKNVIINGNDAVLESLEKANREDREKKSPNKKDEKQ